MDDYERVLLVKQEVFVYRIPPLTTSRGHKAADWKLDSPDYVCRLRIVARGEKLELKLEEKASGELFAKCPVDKYPGPAVEAVLDSSRYFVMRLQDDNGRSALIGVGFADRGDSFDLNVALQDHFRYIGKAAKLHDEETQASSNQPKLDLGFKEGQTITLNIGRKDAAGGSSSGSATSRPRSAGTGNIGGPVPLLPPPPASGSSVAKSRAPPSAAATLQQQPRATTAAGAPSPPSSTSSSLNPFLSSSGAGAASTTGATKPSNALLDFDAAFASSLPPAAPSKAALANPFLSSTTGTAEEKPRELCQPAAASSAVGNLLDL